MYGIYNILVYNVENNFLIQWFNNLILYKWICMFMEKELIKIQHQKLFSNCIMQRTFRTSFYLSIKCIIFLFRTLNWQVYGFKNIVYYYICYYHILKIIFKTLKNWINLFFLYWLDWHHTINFNQTPQNWSDIFL